MPIAVPYRPLPPDTPFGTWRRFRHVVGDPATWLDFAWLVPGAIAGGVCGLLAWVLPLYGLEGVLLIPLFLYFTLDWWGYGLFWPMDNLFEALLSIPQGVVFLAVGLAGARWLTWIEATFASYFLRPTGSAALPQRVRELTVTRADAVDAQAAELRRIERDLHDGAQARLVSLSMSIGLAEELLRRDPEAAAQLLAEARQSSGQALSDLRDLVRGIHPPVLAERGLEGAVRALALTVPVLTSVDIDLPGRPPARSSRPPTSPSPRCWPTWPSTAAPARRGSGSPTATAGWPSRSATTGAAARTRRPARACGGSSVGSPPSMGSWRCPVHRAGRPS